MYFTLNRSFWHTIIDVFLLHKLSYYSLWLLPNNLSCGLMQKQYEMTWLSSSYTLKILWILPNAKKQPFKYILIRLSND